LKEGRGDGEGEEGGAKFEIEALSRLGFLPMIKMRNNRNHCPNFTVHPDKKPYLKPQ